MAENKKLNPEAWAHRLRLIEVQNRNMPRKRYGKTGEIAGNKHYGQ